MADFFSKLASLVRTTGARETPPPAHINKLIIGGVDGREIVESVEAAPWRPFCCMKLSFTGDANEFGYGTGILIRPNIILTAAHNLYSLTARTFVRSLTASVGTKAGAAAASAKAKRVEVCPAYITSLANDSGRYRHDYGICVLDSDTLHTWAGEYVNVTDQAPLDNAEFLRSRLNVAGYPDERPRQTELALKNDSGPIIPSSLTATNFRYQMDTMAGQSGCPVFKYYSNSKRFLFAGVHVGGADNSNLARRYDAGMRDQVKAWLAAYAR